MSSPASSVKGFFVLVGGFLPARRFGVFTVLVLTLRVVLVAAYHRRSLYRPRPPRYLPDLTLYEAPLLATFGKLSIKSLEALLLDVQSAREGVEAFEGSVLKPALEVALPSVSSPSQRQGHRTLLFDGLLRIEEFFRGHAKSSSQLADGAKLGVPD